jgi:hypothetical protein
MAPTNPKRGIEMKKLYRTTLFAGVLAFGLAACGDDVQLVEPTDPPPPTLTATFSPQSVNVAEGQSADLGLNISGGQAGAQASWDCVTGDGSIATASGTPAGCRVTGVGAGSTTVTANVTKGTQTATASAGVTVAELTRASVEIRELRQEGTTADIDNISGQLDVDLNIRAGDESPTQVDVIVTDDEGEATVVASQVFTAEEIAEMMEAAEAESPDVAEQVATQITLSFRTNRYDIEDGEANIWHYNGDKSISAQLHVAQDVGPRASNVIEVVFNNQDGFHVIGTRPENSAMDDEGRRWFGGPDSGDTEALVIPVFFSGQLAQQVTADFCNEGATTIEAEDAPFAFAWECAGYETPDPDDPDAPLISAQYQPDGDPVAPVVILNVDRDDYRFPVRIDNLEPQQDDENEHVFWIVRQSGLDNVGNWLNHQYVFSNGYNGDNVIDEGVGKDSPEHYLVSADADGDEILVGPTEGLTGAGIAEALGDDAETVTNTEYVGWVQVCDRLGNCALFAQEENSADTNPDPDEGLHPLLTFGYDETAPTLTFQTADMGALAEDNVILDEFVAADRIELVASDVASGFAPMTGPYSFNRGMINVGSTFDDPENPTTAALASFGSNAVDHPFAALDEDGLVVTLANLADAVGEENWDLTGQVSIFYEFDLGTHINGLTPTDPSYYIYQVRVRDRAGNTTKGSRSIYHNNGASPEIEAITRSGTFPADPAFRVTFTHDALELFEGSLGMAYPNTGGAVIWERPGAEISSVLRLDAGIEDGIPFNDYIQRPHRDLMLDLGFAGLGLPFIKNIQATDGDGETQETGVEDSKPTGVQAQVYNGLPLELTDIVHGTNEIGQSELVSVGIPAEEVPGFDVDYHEDTDITSWIIVAEGDEGCTANYCAQLYGPTGTFTSPFLRDGVLIVWADADELEPTWRVLEVASPNFSGEFPTRDDGVQRLYEWEFSGTVEGFTGADLEFRAVGVNQHGDGLLSSGLVEEAPEPPLAPTSLNIVSGDGQTIDHNTTSDDLVVEVLDQNDDPMEGITVSFTSSGVAHFISPTSDNTDVDGQASTTVTSGSQNGDVTVTATVGSLSEQFTITVDDGL